jgi:anti-sigma regulatory factor (Ser/Thr protein kinase)
MIEDEAEQVDPCTIKSRCLDEVRPGGLGVHIIREVMDEVAYECRSGGVGMRLTMVKKKISTKPRGDCPDPSDTSMGSSAP